MNGKSYIEANVQARLEEAVLKYASDHPGMNEIEVIGKVTGSSNLKCKLGCENKATLSDTFLHVSFNYPELSKEELKNEIRRRYFVSLSMNYYFNWFRMTHVSCIPFPINIAQKISCFS
jgi:hypothetical protein